MGTITALSKIFSDDDIIYVAGALLPDGKGYDNPRLSKFSNLYEVLHTGHEFFSINPLSFTNRNFKADGSQGSYRASINVSTFKNFLLESDVLPLETQIELVAHLNKHVPLRLVTYSGGKSLHMIISVADTLFPKRVQDPIMLYKQIWEGLAEKATRIANEFLAERGLEQREKIFDSATKDPARLSRLPEAYRADKDREQKVVQVGSLVLGDDLLALATEGKLKQYDSKNTNVDASIDVAAFERKLRNTSSLSFLRDRLEYPDRWTSSSNMYTEMFRYTLWCLDATSVPFNVLDAYLTKRVYPAILAKGYPRDPRAGVLAAYQFKGLL